MKRLVKLFRLSVALVIYTAYANYGGSTMAQRLAAGGEHTCALLPLASGMVSCWGRNDKGQLGNGRLGGSSSVQGTVSNLVGSNVLAIALTSGRDHTCALMSNGVVNCWGLNRWGALGNGTTTDSPVPVTVNNLGDKLALPTAIAAGSYHTCALLLTGTVRCWGQNLYSQLGNGQRNAASEPVTVTDLGGQATAIAAGSFHTCALLTTGDVRCWGLGWRGQLGNDTTTNISPVPVTVIDLGGQATAIAAGANHTCALLTTGAVRCWGENNRGQLGNNTNTNSSVPVTVDLGKVQAIKIAANNAQTCAKMSNGVLRCWGGNSKGQLGNGTTFGSSLPVTVSDLEGLIQATEVTVGFLHTCAFLLNGEVRCWGENNQGQLGTGTNTSSPVPVAVLNP